MTDTAETQAGALEEISDAGEGPAGVVKRWMMELELADKTEKNWRKAAKDVNARYRDEKVDTSSSSYNSIGGDRYSSSNRFNILYSNIQTICPALFNQTPKPDVRRRYRDADKTGKVIADIMERSLSYTMDEYDFDRQMRLAVKDCQLTGRGVTRIKYEAAFEKKKTEAGEEYDEKASEEVCWEHVNWADFRRGPGRTWEEVEWVGFRHILSKAEGVEKFGKDFDDVDLDYSPSGTEDDGKEGDPITDTFKRSVVWEIWDQEEKKVIFIAPSLKERPLKKDDDPLELAHFFPVPRPLYATENTDSLVPVEPFRFYRDQADELDRLTKRISGIIDACKVRGIYDSTINELSTLLAAGENVLIPAGDVLPLMANGGLEKAIWMWPIEKIVGVLNHLYMQREAIKTTIYEITGIADIMRGSSSAQETLGAQQLKAQFGTMRLDDMRREVQRYARDLVRMSAEVMAEHFSKDTMAMMTEVQLPTNEQKAMAQQAAQKMEQEGQPIPKKLKEGLKLPTWEEALQVLRDDKQRAYRIDIETDSTVAGDQAAEQKAMTELLTGVSTYFQNAGPAVAQGYLPLEAAKSILMTAVRRFKMGREVEDALDMIGEKEDGEEEGPSPEQQQMQAKMQEMQGQLQQLSQENQKLVQTNEAMKTDNTQAHEKAMAELDIKSRELHLKEREADKPEPDQTIKTNADAQATRDKMVFDAEQKELDRENDRRKIAMQKLEVDQETLMSVAMGADLPAQNAVIADGLNQLMEAIGVLMEQTQAVNVQLLENAEIAKAPKSIIRDSNNMIVGVEIAPSVVN